MVYSHWNVSYFLSLFCCDFFYLLFSSMILIILYNLLVAPHICMSSVCLMSILLFYPSTVNENRFRNILLVHHYRVHIFSLVNTSACCSSIWKHIVKTYSQECSIKMKSLITDTTQNFFYSFFIHRVVEGNFQELVLFILAKSILAVAQLYLQLPSFLLLLWLLCSCACLCRFSVSTLMFLPLTRFFAVCGMHLSFPWFVVSTLWFAFPFHPLFSKYFNAFLSVEKTHAKAFILCL